LRNFFRLRERRRFGGTVGVSEVVRPARRLPGPSLQGFNEAFGFISLGCRWAEKTHHPSEELYNTVEVVLATPLRRRRHHAGYPTCQGMNGIQGSLLWPYAVSLEALVA